jgi:glycosyltransferase involved in cell wall biosynthesis
LIARRVVRVLVIPVPADTGGKRRSLAILREYVERGAEVTLCAHDDGSGDVAALTAMGVEVHAVPWNPSLLHMAKWFPRFRSLLLTRFWSPGLRDAALDAARRGGPFDVLQVEYLQNVTYLGVPASVTVLDLHDVVSEQTARIGRHKRGLVRMVYALEARRAGQLERAALRQFDVVACVSETDKRLLPRDDAIVAPNGWEAGPLRASASEPVVTMTANFAFATNEDAAVWFVRAVWPKVRAGVPAAKLILVGREPTPAVRRLAELDGVQVTGTVPSVEPFLDCAAVSVAPLRSGGGSRLKILEALEAGKPVVTTSLGYEGLEELDGRGVRVADDPGEMAGAILELLENPAQAATLGADGRRAVHERYLWSATLQPLFDEIKIRLGGAEETQVRNR